MAIVLGSLVAAVTKITSQIEFETENVKTLSAQILLSSKLQLLLPITMPVVV